MIEYEIHKSFIGSLILVAIITLLLIFFSRQIVYSYIETQQKSPVYTSQKSYDNQTSASE